VKSQRDDLDNNKSVENMGNKVTGQNSIQNEVQKQIKLTHYSGRVTQICVFNTVKLGTAASSP